MNKRMTQEEMAYEAYRLDLIQAETLRKKKNKSLDEVRRYDSLKDRLMRLDRRYRFSSRRKSL